MSLLLLTAGGLYMGTMGRPATAPKEVAEPPDWEIDRLKPVIGGVNETLARLCRPVPRSISPRKLFRTAPTSEPTAIDPPQPVTTKADAEGEDHIAAWLANKSRRFSSVDGLEDAAEIPPTPAA